MKKCYVVVARSYGYNDEYNYPEEGYSIDTIYKSKKDAEKVAADCNREWLRSNDMNEFSEGGFADMLNFDYKQRDKLTSELLEGIGIDYLPDDYRSTVDFSKCTNDQLDKVIEHMREMPYWVVESKIDE